MTTYEKLREKRNILIYGAKVNGNLLELQSFVSFADLKRAVTLQDVLRMMERHKELNSGAIGIDGNLCLMIDNDLHMVYIDLAKDIKDQDKEVLEKLLELVK